MTQQPTPNDDLAPLRQRIDELDQRILKCLNERASVVVEIGRIKRVTAAPTYAPDRERTVLDKVISANEGPLPDKCIESIWRELMSGSFSLEAPLRVGFLGPEGSFSHLAATKQFGACVEYRCQEDIPSVFKSVEAGRSDLGLVPIENSTGGGIQDTLDCFIHTTAHVCAEVLIPVHHNLMARCDFDSIKRIVSRPEVFSQCRHWLGMNLRQADRVACVSSAKAAEMASVEEGTAAIGSSMAANVYGLTILRPNVEDNPNNVTRFFVISKQSPGPTGKDKTALLFTTPHRSGALAEALDVFRRHGVNLTHIDKRPSQVVNWEYYFFVDCEGHVKDLNVAAALTELRKICLQLTVLGSFPAARNILG